MQSLQIYIKLKKGEEPNYILQRIFAILSKQFFGFIVFVNNVHLITNSSKTIFSSFFHSENGFCKQSFLKMYIFNTFKG